MSNELRIYLDSPNQYYSPGEIITGRVECSLIKEKKIRAVLIEFKGICSTSWIESESYYDDFFKEDRRRDVPYNGEESYFNREFDISKPGRDSLNLSPGKHIFPFAYQLPHDIPTSFEDENGWANIRYTIKAKIDCPWEFDIESLAVFNVVSPLDLNLIPRIREPVEMSVDKVLCSCWCNNNDTLTFTFTLPTVGYVPGQDVKVGVYVENLTNVSVERVTFKITKFTEYKATSPMVNIRNTSELIVDSFDGGIGAHGEKSWTSTLPIPTSKSFPNMSSCNLIKITYRLKGVVVIPYPHTNLSAFVPLHIGNIPLIGENLNVSLGPPPEMDRLPYVDATAPPSENASLHAFGNRNNYGAVYEKPENYASGEPAPPSYNEVVRSTSD